MRSEIFGTDRQDKHPVTLLLELWIEMVCRITKGDDGEINIEILFGEDAAVGNK